MQIGEFTLANDEKVHRAIYGVPGREGKNVGGIGENAKAEAIIAEYDRLGGLILKGDIKVKMGSFYDFDAKKPRTEPKVVFVDRIEDEEVELTEDEAKAVKKAKTKKVKAKK